MRDFDEIKRGRRDRPIGRKVGEGRESRVVIFEEPKLANPILIEGLPGIGFVGNIVALHLIRELNAKKFAEIHSPAFQDLVVSTKEGSIRQPISELYYASHKDVDLIILYGNTQALTSYGQYEVCGKILDVARSLGSNFVVCIGGIRKREMTSSPKVYCTATDQETLSSVLRHSIGIAKGYILGAAGVLMGLTKLKNMRGFCLLVETPGTYSDPIATESALKVLCKVLNMEVDLSRLSVATENTKKALEGFGLLRAPHRKKGYLGLFV